MNKKILIIILMIIALAILIIINQDKTILGKITSKIESNQNILVYDVTSELIKQEQCYYNVKGTIINKGEKEITNSLLTCKTLTYPISEQHLEKTKQIETLEPNQELKFNLKILGECTPIKKFACNIN